MSSLPSLSVVIPVHNAERVLQSTLESVLGQNYPSIEIIVIDDGSTDGSLVIAQGIQGPIRCVPQERSGPPAARNAGLRLARGELLAFLDADDLWSKDRLAVQVPLFLRHPGVEVVAGRFQWVREDLTPLENPRHPLSLGTALFHRSVFDRVGALDERLWYSDDVDWYLRARELGVPMHLHEEVVLRYRRHEGNITNEDRRAREFYLTALKRSLDRRRSRPGALARPLPAWDDFTGKTA